MRLVLLLLLLCLPAWADGPFSYSCLNLDFSLPLAFSSPQESAAASAYEMYYPTGRILDYDCKLALASLAPDKADKKTQWFDLTYKSLIDIGDYSPTGQKLTFLGQAVPEVAGTIRDPISSGRALAYLVPRPDGGFLFVGLKTTHGDGDLARVAAALSQSLRWHP